MKNFYVLFALASLFCSNLSAQTRLIHYQQKHSNRYNGNLTRTFKQNYQPKFNKDTRQAMHLGISTQPTLWQSKVMNGGLVLKSDYLPQWGVYGELSAYQGSALADPFTITLEQKSQAIEARWYPLQGDLKQLRQLCGGKISCIAPKTKSPWINGIYVAPGYRIQRSQLAFIPNTELESPIPTFPFTIQTKAFTLYGGYHLRIKCIQLDVAYGGQLGKAHVTSEYSDLIPIDLNNIQFPVAMQLKGILRLQAGFIF